MRLPKPLIAFLILLPLAPSTRADTPTPDQDRWYSLLLQDQPAGWAHHTTRHDKNQITSSQTTHITLRRGAQTLSIDSEQSFTESPTGQPLAATLNQTLGTMQMKQSYRFTPTGIQLTTTQAGRVTQSTLPPLKGDFLTPAAAERYAESQFLAGSKEIRFRTISVETGLQPMDVSITILGHENIQVLGKTVPAIRTRQTLSIAPAAVATSYVDEKGHELKTDLELMPGMKLTMLASDKDLATANISPPELLNVMLVTPDKQIPSPRTLRRAVYQLDIERNQATPPPSIPAGGPQSVTWTNDSKATARLTIDLDSPDPGDRTPTDLDRKPSAMIDSSDPRVRALADKALKDKPNLSAPEKAQALRAFVYHFIKKKNLSVGFASASEVARTAEGDCTEHAVLLAALLRTQNIPSRTVSGLIYADQFAGHQSIFGYHMWTQAFLPDAKHPTGRWTDLDAKHPTGRWTDLDATLPTTPFDATHIALGLSNLSDATQGNDMVQMSQLIGRIKIRVLDPK